MFDPRQRLFSHWIPGESFHEEPEYVGRLMGRAVVEQRKDPVAKHREPVEYKVRRRRVRLEAGPNAPQLMRVWRNPYEQELDYFRRRRSGERARPAKRERINVAATLRSARRQERPKFPKPTDCHPPLMSRPRPSAAAWLGSSEGGDR